MFRHWQNGQMKLPVLMALLCGLACNAETIEGLVVGVADGDTVTVLDAERVHHKVRMSGIDAPEKRQAFGQRAKESLKDIVFGKAVMIETDKRDRYGREVGKILVGGVDANLEQVTRGFAWHYKAYEREQSDNDRKLYASSEAVAKSEKRGLWRDVDPTPPWDFRKEKRDAK